MFRINETVQGLQESIDKSVQDFQTSADNLQETIDNINNFCEKVGNVFYTLAHPVIIWDWCMDRITPVTIIISIFLVTLAAMTESEKPKKLLSYVITIYVFLIVLDLVI